jgi:hypothetical protein
MTDLPPTDPRFLRIRDHLALAVGRAQAVTLERLAALCSMPRREVEAIIEERLLDFPWPIVSSSDGLFRPTRAEEINAYLSSLHSRHRRMQIREATVRRKARAGGWPFDGSRFSDPPAGQGELFAGASAWR